MMIIWSGGLFTCDQSGNGARITLTNESTGASVYLQGDDAVRFCEDRDLLEAKFPHWHFDQTYSWLWDQMGYGETAA